ncbi:MAG TPA: aminoglycoside 3'-phosphotransferase/choline kinase family protein [Polyangiales bacterium]
MPLPAKIDPEDFDTDYRLDPREWRFAIEELCAIHGVSHRQVRAFPQGSNLVAAVDERWVVKIFPPFHRHQWESERRVLPRIHGQLSVAVPALIAQGTREDGWTYVIVEKLSGVLLESCWPSLTHADKRRILTQIGAAMASAHAVPVEELSKLPPDWNTFVRVQAVASRERHERRGMPDWLIAGMDELVGDGAAFEIPERERVLLTGEYTPFNLLAHRGPRGWHLSGMFDFGDAMIGPRDYDLLGPSLFLAEGNAALIAALFRGYTGGRAQLDADRRMRLLGLMLLHRYSNLDNQIRIPRWRERARSPLELAKLIWPEPSLD